MDLPPPRRRQLARGELPDLLVGEREVGSLIRRLRQQEPGAGGGLEIVGERIGTVDPTRFGRLLRSQLARPDTLPDGPQVAKAEAASEDRGVAERGPRPGRQPCRPPVDQRPDRRRHESRRIPAEPPLAIDLLERSGLSMGARQLLDDEGDALRLDVHRRRGRGLDGPAENQAGPSSRIPSDFRDYQGDAYTAMQPSALNLPHLGFGERGT